jgi:hypothetical protein
MKNPALICIAAFALLFASTGNAQETSTNATGTWKWTVTMPDGNTLEPVLKLKQEGEKLTGTSSYRPDRETPITEGVAKGGTVSFKVVRERDGRQFVTSYKGKVAGDTLKGTIQSNFGGEDRTFDWEAKRQPDATGNWEWSFTSPNGQTFTSKLSLKQEGDKLTGHLSRRDGNETAIENAKVKDNEISFEVTRERDGQKFTSKYSGKVGPDAIKGTVDLNVGGETRTRDWEAKKVK